MNYRLWQAEILQQHAEGCIQVDLNWILWFCSGGVLVINIFQAFHVVPVPNSAQTLDMDQSLLSTALKCCDARSVLLFHLLFEVYQCLSNKHPSPGYLLCIYDPTNLTQEIKS